MLSNILHILITECDVDEIFNLYTHTYIHKNVIVEAKMLGIISLRRHDFWTHN